MSQPSIAANRYGYGLKAGQATPANPKAWLLSQMEAFRPALPPQSGVPNRAEIATSLASFLDMARDMRAMEDQKPMIQKARQETRVEGRDHYTALVSARFKAAIESDCPFVERLVHFWANHFAISADKLVTIGLGGMLEIEAVRPHVLGRFEDMLLAVERDPAMLLYLDQAQSIGPNSELGSRIQARGGKNGGLNENLAREILELHTLGVRTGYAQADVTEFARALTGWTVAGIARGPVVRAIGVEGTPGDFAFAQRIHEPGARAIMGKAYPQMGEAQARAILSDLARHPSTARHISTKLARHFAGDEPPPALVSRLERAFLETRGDLKALYAVLVEAPEIWSRPSAKFKTPWDWMVSSHRALQLPAPPSPQIAQQMTQLGQAVWRSGSPAGYDDNAASWAGPDAVFRRVELAERLATRAGVTNPNKLAEQLFPGGLSEATKAAIARAESPVQGTALLLVSPEFLRR